MNEGITSIADLSTTVRLRAAHRAPIDITSAVDGIGDLGWLGLRIETAESSPRQRIRTDLELPIFDGSAVGPIRKAALIDIGRARIVDDAVIVDVGWQSASAAPLFPVFAGRLRITSDGLYLDGRYVPPFGRLGLLVDEGILHLVARRTAKAFLARIAEHLTG